MARSKSINFSARLSERAKRLMEEMRERIAAIQGRPISQSDAVEVAFLELSRSKKYPPVQKDQE